MKTEFHLTVMEVSFNILALASFKNPVETANLGDLCSLLVTAHIVGKWGNHRLLTTET